MKFTKILAAVLAAMMLMLCFTACDSGDGQSDDQSSSEAENVNISVSIKVLDVDGKTVYSADKYQYSGKAPTIITLLDDYLYMEKDTELTYDDYGTLFGIGSVECTDITESDGNGGTNVLYNTYWWYRVNGQEGRDLLESYMVQDGDVLEIYMATKASEG